MSKVSLTLAIIAFLGFGLVGFSMWTAHVWTPSEPTVPLEAFITAYEYVDAKYEPLVDENNRRLQRLEERMQRLEDAKAKGKEE